MARGIPGEVLAAGRFQGWIEIDTRGNAVLPLLDADGLSGSQIKRDFDQLVADLRGRHRFLQGCGFRVPAACLG